MNNKEIWNLSTKTPFGYDKYELSIFRDGDSSGCGEVRYGETIVGIGAVDLGKNYIKAKFRTDIPISEDVEISMSGLEDQMYGFVKIGDHTQVEAFAIRSAQ